MSRPVPLMFIQQTISNEPLRIEDEESTTIFHQPSDAEDLDRIDSEMQKKLQRLSTSFGQRVYQDITFIMQDQEVIGNVVEIDDTLTEIHVELRPEEVVVLQTEDLIDIKWRGKSLPNT